MAVEVRYGMQTTSRTKSLLERYGWRIQLVILLRIVVLIQMQQLIECSVIVEQLESAANKRGVRLGYDQSINMPFVSHKLCVNFNF